MSVGFLLAPTSPAPAAPIQKAKEAEGERNRAMLAQVNAEIRREKAKLRAQLPDLVKLSKKKARKLPEEKKKERLEKIDAIERDLEAVPDGTAHDKRKRRDKLLAQAGPINISVDVNNMQLNPLSMEHSEESQGFRSEFMQSKQKQDVGLEQISKGLRTLKDMSSAMNDELKKQDPLMDSIDTKTSDATAELRTANSKLKALLMEMRQPHKLCLDLILVSVLLGIGSYIFTMVKPSTTQNLKNSAANLQNKVTGGSSTPASGRHLLELMLSGGSSEDALAGLALLNDQATQMLLR